MEDLSFVNYVARHQSIYKYAKDDFNPDNPEEFDMKEGLSNNARFYLAPIYKGKVRIGIFSFFPWNYITYEIHAMVLPPFRGLVAILGAKLSISWMFKNTRCRKIVANIPVYNRGAYALARKVKMQQEGINRKSFLHNGILYDQLFLGISKEK